MRTTIPKPQLPTSNCQGFHFQGFASVEGVNCAAPARVERQECRMGTKRTSGSALALCHHEQPPEREKRLARCVPGVSLRHPLAVGGLKGRLLLTLQDIQISRQPGALGPFLDRIL